MILYYCWQISLRIILYCWQVALRIRPLKHEESARGYKAVAAKIDSKVGLQIYPYFP